MNSNFKYLGKIEIKNVYEKVKNGPWKNESSNLRSKSDSNRYTETIPIRWNQKSLNASLDKMAKKNEFYEEFYDGSFFNELKKILTHELGKGYFVRILFTKLYKKCEIIKHKDYGRSLRENHRVHVPIKSNSKVEFTIQSEEYVEDSEKETIVMKEGEIWEIDNSKWHGVINKSDEDRIHLIVDWHTL